ncbi:MAG TPA: methionine adenosyltransferase [Clostridia bacterium]
MKYKLFTSESVTIGHPDKICDQISDAVLDSILEQDPDARVACDVAVNTGLVLVMGEITTDCYVDIPKIVRQTVKEIGYTDARYGFDYNSCAILTSIDEQSADIAMGVLSSADYKDTQDPADLIGAGDQGMVFGYACRETEELMPLPITLAHALTKNLAEYRLSGKLPYLRPDGKAQVTVIYQGGVPVGVDSVLVSAQHAEDVDRKTMEKDIWELVNNSIPQKYLNKDTKFLLNPTGRFVIGGPQGDSGLTGRKIIADTYGGYCPHGGGAFSGKDPTKVDRSAAYMARYICKNIVAAGLADKCQIEISYAIGKARPVSLNVETFGTSKYSDYDLMKIITEVFDLRPYGIIKTLDLKRPIYKQTAKNGHFGKPEFPWEKTDKIDDILLAAKSILK